MSQKILKTKNAILNTARKLRLRTWIAIGVILVLTPIAFFALYNPDSSEAAWYNESWTYRKKITIDADQVSGSTDFNDFVVLVSVTDSALATKAQRDGDDIIFTDINGNKLPHDIAEFDSSGILVAWVRVPILFSADDTILYAYYGNPSATNSEKPVEVWEDYTGVWHMDESSGGTAAVARADFSPYGNYLTDNGNTPSTAGKIADALSTNGSSQYLSIIDDDEAGVGFDASYTLSAWVSMDSDAVAGGLLSRSDGNSDNDFELAWKDQGGGTYGFVLTHSASGGGTSTSNSTYNAANYTDDTDIMVTAIYDDANDQLRWYINGSASGSTSSFTNELTATTQPLWVGRVNTSYWDGRIDEVRYAPTIRSADWIATEYANQNSPVTFLSLGSEEAGRGPVLNWKYDTSTADMCAIESTQAELSGIQKGDLTLGTSSSSVSENITTVDAGKSFLLYNLRQDEDTPECGLVAGELASNGASVTFYRDDGSCQNNIEIEYSVVEFESGVSVQRGSVAHNAVNPQTITLSQSVDVNKSFPLINTINSFTAWSGADYQKIEITDEDTVVISGTGSNTPTVSYWQVVEYDDAIVQHGSVSFGTGDSSKNATITNEIDPEKTWLLYSYDSGGGTDTRIDQKMIRGEITSNTQLTFDRDSTGSTAELIWYLVEFQNGTNVQSGTSNFGTSDTTLTPSISTITTANSVVTAGAEMYTGGSTDYSGNDIPGHGYATMEFTSSTQLTLTRAVSGSNASITWFVVDFDDSVPPISGDGVCDSSGNNYHGAINGAAYVPPEMCVDGSCLQFDGSNDYVARNDTLDLDFSSTSSFAITSWFRHKPQSSGTDVLVAKYESTGSDGGYKVYMDDDGDIVCGIDDENTSFPEDWATTSGAAMDDNKWHHVACVKDGTSSLKLYIDGLLTDTDSSISADTTIANDDPFYVGIDGDGTSNPWEGFIDETKIYRTALTAEEVKLQFIGGGNVQARENHKEYLTDGLIGYWRLDEASGNAADSSGNGYTLTNNGTTTYVNGKYGNGSEHVPASTQYFSTASTINGISTISFWVNPDSNTNNYINLTASQYVTSSSGTLSATGFTGTFYVNGVQTTAIAADAWQHVVVILSSPVNADAFYLGRASSSYFDGTLDEARLYTTVLSSQQIQNLYQWAPSPAGHWRFDEGTGSTAYDTSGNENHVTIGEFTSSAANITLQETVSGGTTGTSITLSSWTPSADDLILVSVNIRASSTEAVQSISGNGLTFEKIRHHDDTQNVIYMEMWRAMGSSPTTGSITITFNADVRSAVASASRFSGANTDGTNGSGAIEADVSADVGGTDGTAISVDISTLTGNAVVYGAAGTRARTFTVGSGYTAITNYETAGEGGDVSRIMTEYKTVGTPDTLAVDATLNSASEWIVIGVSIKPDVPVGISGWVPGVFGYGYAFDGIDDRATITDNDKLDFGAGSSFTISSWFKHPTIADGQDNLLAKYDDSSGDLIGYSLYMLSSGTIECKTEDGSDNDFVTSTDDYDDNLWHHVACVRDGLNDMYLYIDGQLVDTDTSIIADNSLANNQPLYIGVEYTGDENAWMGSMDDIKLYNYARSQEQVIQDMEGAIVGGGIGDPLPQPINYWNLDEQSGQTVHDMSGNNNGTLGASSSVSTDDPAWKTIADCKVNGCLSFDGGDYVDVGTGPTTVNSVSFWIKPTTTTEHIIDLNGTNYIYINSGILTAQGFNSPKIYINGIESTAVAASVWQHVVVTTATTISASDLDIGRVEGVGNYAGLLDEVRVYSSMLSAYQVKLDYNTASALAVSTTSDEADDISDGAGDNPIAYWKLDEGQNNTCTGGSNDACDKSGNSHDGSITGAVWKSGKYGSSLYFDGNGDYLNIYSSAFNTAFNGNEGTISLWMKPYGAAFWTDDTQRWIVQLRVDGSNYLTINRQSGDNELGFFHAGGGTSSDIYLDNLNFTDWTHIALTYSDSGDKMMAYINGSQTGEIETGIGTFTGNLASSNTVIGAYQTTNIHPFYGYIDDIKIYDYARTSAQIAYDYNRGAPVGHWRMDECQGTSANDASGNGNDGTITITASGGNTNGAGNCQTATSAWGSGATGKYYASLYFDGDGDYVDIGDTGRTDIYAVSFWAKPADTTESFLQLSSSDTVAVSSGTISVGGFGTETVYVDGVQTTSFPDNSWHHVTIVSSSAITANDMDIGHISTTYFAGQIDDVQIFNYTPSANQIRKLYNASSAVRFE